MFNAVPSGLQYQVAVWGMDTHITSRSLGIFIYPLPNIVRVVKSRRMR